MTSKNSFWDSMKENNRRRVWVWVVAILCQFSVYVGILMIYLSRVRQYNSKGIYKTLEEYTNALHEAAGYALGLRDDIYLVTAVFLALIIGIQGFSYLYDRKKVDMYHSVPVSKNRRFFTVYVNGILIYLVSTLTALCTGVLIAVMQGAANGEVLAHVGLAFLWNLLVFLVLYHTAILSVMLTGSLFITICGFGVFAGYEVLLYMLINSYESNFFESYNSYFVSSHPKLSVVWDNMSVMDGYMGGTSIADSVKPADTALAMLPYYGKWFALAAVLLAAAYLCYKKRPSEAAGKALAYRKTEPVIKIAVAVPVAMALGILVYDASYDSVAMMLVGMMAGGVICCAFMEVIYDFDIKSVLKHLISSGIALAGILAVFFIFKMDLFGYDNYIPDESDVESIAFSTNNNYYSYWNEEFDYVPSTNYLMKNMHITDTEPVLELAKRAQEKSGEDMSDLRYFYVLYRLKSGREVGRQIRVDFDDPANEECLNRLIGTEEWRKGTIQTVTDAESYDYVKEIAYANGVVRIAVPYQDAQTLREAWIKDMEQFDFSFARANYPCGRINFVFSKYMDIDLPVYEGFDNTIAYLKSQGAYYPAGLNASDIAEVTVTNYHHDMMQEDNPVTADQTLAMGRAEEYGDFTGDFTVKATFTDEEQIAQIASCIYPTYRMDLSWHRGEKDFDNNYEINVVFKSGTAYPYESGNYYFTYRFFAGQVPDFVAEATAYRQ